LKAKLLMSSGFLCLCFAALSINWDISGLSWFH